MNSSLQLGFDSIKPTFTINKPVRLIELFAGIGAQAKALERLGVDFEKWIISEWEVNATKSYKAIHCPDDNTDYSKALNQKELINALFAMGISSDGKKPLTEKQISRKGENWLRETYNAYKATHNISNLMLAAGCDLNIVDADKYTYILTYSFPCQDLSLAGKQKGMSKGSNTRSGLLWEVERLLNECDNLPQVLLMENVTQVHNKQNADDFNQWLNSLETLGYTNYYADLNAKDYGVPQNRNRTFMISILGDYYYEFPQPFLLQKRMKDVLESNVDEKYYLSEKAVKYITNPKRMAKNYTNIDSDIASTITAEGQNNWTGSFVSDNTIKQVAQLYPNSGNPQNGRVFSSDGICCGLKTPQGGNSQPMIIEYCDSVDKVQIEPCIAASRGQNPDNPNDRTAGLETEQRLEIKTDGTNNTLTTIQKDNLVVEPIIYDDYNSRIPKDQNVIGTLTTNIGNSAKGNGIKIIEPVCINSKDETNKWLNVSDKIYTSIITSRLFYPYCLNIGFSIMYRIRRLTPKECLRLMTFDDADYERIKAAGISDSAIYKQAGNSIVVDVLMFIISQLFNDTE